MLNAEDTALLTQVGPETPGGQLLRRYWHPICFAADLVDRPTFAVKILDEELVVYRDGETYGVLHEHCPHRGASLAYGWVEKGCVLRCPYHGWAFDACGNTVDTPFEPNAERFRSRIKHKAYPAQELGGIVFVYMGPMPAPLLPRWDVLVRTDGHPVISKSPVLDCNWLQPQENAVDTTHTYSLHAQTLIKQGLKEHPAFVYYNRPFVAYGFHSFEWGMLKSFVTRSNGKDSAEIGNPLIFPNMVRVKQGVTDEALHWRVPVDDEHTLIFHISFFVNEDGSDTGVRQPPTVEPVPPKKDAEGRYILDDFFRQDWMVWETQGKIFDRSKEHLGSSDRGIAMFRRMLKENIETVANGGEPIALVRDPQRNVRIDFNAMVADPDLDMNQLVKVDKVWGE